jgi:hypothetical protein
MFSSTFIRFTIVLTTILFLRLMFLVEPILLLVPILLSSFIPFLAYHPLIFYLLIFISTILPTLISLITLDHFDCSLMRLSIFLFIINIFCVYFHQILWSHLGIAEFYCYTLLFSYSTLSLALILRSIFNLTFIYRIVNS